MFVGIVPEVARCSPLLGGYYVEDRTLTSPIPDDTGNNLFGVAVAISDGTALVGAARESGSGNAHLYNAETGALLHTFSPESSSEQSFGRSVALGDGYAVVGAEEATYVYSAHNYQLLHTLPRGSTIGITKAIDIDEGRVLFASRFANRVYDLATGNHLVTINTNMQATSVALSGDYAIIGAIADRSGPGSAQVYDWRNERFLYDLTPADMPDGAQFGASVAADGNRVVVGAFDDPTIDAGGAYVFDLTTGEELHRLAGSLATNLSSFGYDVAMKNGVAMVAAYRQNGYFPDSASENPSYVFDHGAVYAFSVQTGEEIARFTTAGPRTGGEATYGFSIDFDGDQLIAGTLGWPKKAYITDTAIPEPGALILLSSITVLCLLRRPLRIAEVPKV